MWGVTPSLRPDLQRLQYGSGTRRLGMGRTIKASEIPRILLHSRSLFLYCHTCQPSMLFRIGLGHPVLNQHAGGQVTVQRWFGRIRNDGEASSCIPAIVVDSLGC